MTRPDLPVPGTMDRLPKDKHGRPVPWFVAWYAGQPDHRIIRRGALTEALSRGLCWLCGNPFLRTQDRTFVVGPMCAINRISSEPPSHLDCAVYAAQACPFLTTPSMGRRDRHIPADVVEPAGLAIRANPGVALVWTTGHKSWRPVTVPTYGKARKGTLFDIGDPKAALWFAHGRPATRDEVLAAIDGGMPALRAIADQSGENAAESLHAAFNAVLPWLPAEDSHA